MQLTEPVLLQAEGLERRVASQAVPLLQDLSFSVRAGQRWAVTGPSGSGKTILLRALALLDPLSAGQIRWRGQTITREQVPGYRSQVIFQHQRPAMIGATVEEELKFPFTLGVHQDRSYDPKVVERWLDCVGRSVEFLRKRVQGLSGGEQQIAALLRSMQLEPQMLLLDEPTAALDAATSRAVERLILDWQSQQPSLRSYILVSHDMEQTRRMADHSIMIEGGRMLGVE